MEFNEFREKVKEALPDFLTDDLRNAEIKDTAVNKLQGESYSGISVGIQSGSGTVLSEKRRTGAVFRSDGICTGDSVAFAGAESEKAQPVRRVYA